MATPKTQVIKDSYDLKDNPNRSMQTLDTIPATVGFEFRPQVRGVDQGVSMTTLVLEQGQSGDTEGGGDTFNMTTPMGGC